MTSHIVVNPEGVESSVAASVLSHVFNKSSDAPAGWLLVTPKTKMWFYTEPTSTSTVSTLNVPATAIIKALTKSRAKIEIHGSVVFTSSINDGELPMPVDNDEHARITVFMSLAAGQLAASKESSYGI